jgi:hypothetical protein
VLRHQLIVLRRKLKCRARLTNCDRGFIVQMYRCFPSILKVVTIVQPGELALGRLSPLLALEDPRRGGEEVSGVAGAH